MVELQPYVNYGCKSSAKISERTWEESVGYMEFKEYHMFCYYLYIVCYTPFMLVNVRIDIIFFQRANC